MTKVDGKWHFTLKEKVRKFFYRFTCPDITLVRIKEYSFKGGISFYFNKEYFGLWYWYNFNNWVTRLNRSLPHILSDIAQNLWRQYNRKEISVPVSPKFSISDKITDKKRIGKCSTLGDGGVFFLVKAKKHGLPILRYEYKSPFLPSFYSRTIRKCLRCFFFDVLDNKDMYERKVPQ